MESTLLLLRIQIIEINPLPYNISGVECIEVNLRVLKELIDNK